MYHGGGSINSGKIRPVQSIHSSDADTDYPQAHSHARRAAVETSKSRLAHAATEHQAAAEQYAKAQNSTCDHEALRMLKLLEEHHTQLADIIHSKHTIAKAIKDAQDADILASSTPVASLPPAPVPSPDASSPPVARIHPSRRESSSALAKEMATRRGIPQQSSTLKQPKSKPPADLSAVTSSPSLERRAAPTLPIQSRDQDDGFSRFYSNWTTGPLSRLSSMLAFTALPLTDSQESESPTSLRDPKTSARASNDPDVKSLISPAALNALQKHGHIGPGESFYIIPPSGGTASYANIVTREQRYARRQHLSGINEDDPVEFVDAQETQPVKQQQQPNRGLISVREEELQLENDTLKNVLDQMSHRLQAFESHAQDASMAALTHSVASVRTTHSSSARQQEDELQMAMREIQKLKHDNSKYKAYYTKLRDSARAKAEEKKRAESGG
jgi:hypothetical protein